MKKTLLEFYLETLEYNEKPEFINKYLNTPSLNRLKKVGYFCGMDYASKHIYNFKEHITRYDHSLTVALLTWKCTKDKKATLAGLFHDIATPCFSHVIDYMNKDYENQESTEEYTEDILKKDTYLSKCLKEDNIKLEDIIKFKQYNIVDNNRPKVCADRLDGVILTGISWTKNIDYKDIKNIVKIQLFSSISLPFVIYLIYTLIFDTKNTYRLNRIKVIMEPFKYENGEGYQLSNSLLAIGNGGVTGQGMGNGIMKLGYLPEPHTDFIFSVLAEEAGLIGVIAVIALYMYITFKGIIYANTTKNNYYKIICIGVVSYLFLQVFINLAGISGIIPLTGVTLPLLSYGGSSLLSISVAFGLLLATTKKINMEKDLGTDK